jgi:hypothetical protein
MARLHLDGFDGFRPAGLFPAHPPRRLLFHDVAAWSVGRTARLRRPEASGTSRRYCEAPGRRRHLEVHHVSSAQGRSDFDVDPLVALPPVPRPDGPGPLSAPPADEPTQ